MNKTFKQIIKEDIQSPFAYATWISIMYLFLGKQKIWLLDARAIIWLIATFLFSFFTKAFINYKLQHLKKDMSSGLW